MLQWKKCNLLNEMEKLDWIKNTKMMHWTIQSQAAQNVRNVSQAGKHFF